MIQPIPPLYLERLTDAVTYEREHRTLPNVIHLQNLFLRAHKLSIQVGRSRSMDVVLDSRRVPSMTSRNHATFVWNVLHDQVLLQPSYNNTHGVYVNETRVHHPDVHVLKVGDVISFGGAAHCRACREDPVRYQVAQSTSTRLTDVYEEDALRMAFFTDLALLLHQEKSAMQRCTHPKT